MKAKKNWKIDECLDSNGFATIREDDGSPNGDTETCIATVYDCDAARLIAAAPDLLEAVLSAENALACSEDVSLALYVLRSVINKATNPA